MEWNVNGMECEWNESIDACQTKYIVRMQRRAVVAIGDWFYRWKATAHAIAEAEAAAVAAAAAAAEAEAERQRKIARGVKVVARVVRRRLVRFLLLRL